MGKIPYRLDPEAIGYGGFAVVHRGVHRQTGDVAAIKRPFRNETARARFDREIEIQTTLDHPNVMPILAHGIQPLWFAMPLAARNLTTAVERDRDVVSQLPEIIRAVARGLQHAHRQGFAHRDVNPNNILELKDASRASSRWVVADWGLVRRPPGESSPRLTRTDRPLGTEGFVAPEAELDPHGADATSDVFSIGRVAYFVVTGTWPRRGFPLPEPGWLWSEFVARCTAPRETRVKSMAGVLQLLSRIDRELRRMQDQAEGISCPVCGIPISGTRCNQCGRVWD
jgi:eukaryotic-like serine/threonine-protein kinase